MPIKVPLPSVKPYHLPTPAWLALPAAMTKKRPIPAQAKLCERSCEIRTPIDEHSEARHVPSLWPDGVVTHHAFNRSDFAATAVWPAVNFGPLETRILEHSR